MSRSFKHYAAGGNTTGHSEKEDKQFWHRVFRRVQRQNLLHAQRVEELDDYLPVFTREKSEVWKFNKDGKGFHHFSERELLKETFSSLQAYGNCSYQCNNLDEIEPWRVKYTIKDLIEWLEYEYAHFEYRLGFWNPWDFITEDQVREYARQKYKSCLCKDNTFWLKRYRKERAW